MPVLINKINQKRSSGHISTLIYACSECNCAEWIAFFVSLAIDLEDSSYMEAISVIKEIKGPITLSDKIVSVKQPNDYLISMGKGNQKHENMETLLELIDTMETK